MSNEIKMNSKFELPITLGEQVKSNTFAICDGNGPFGVVNKLAFDAIKHSVESHDHHVARIAELEDLVKSYKHASDRMTKYKHMLSYNDSYAGEPEGEIKDAMGDLDMVSCKALRLLEKSK